MLSKEKRNEIIDLLKQSKKIETENAGLVKMYLTGISERTGVSNATVTVIRQKCLAKGMNV